MLVCFHTSVMQSQTNKVRWVWVAVFLCVWLCDCGSVWVCLCVHDRSIGIWGMCLHWSDTPFDCMYVGVKESDPSVDTIPVNKNLCQMWQPCPFTNKILINWQGILALTDYNYEKFMNVKSNNIPRCWTKFTWEILHIISKQNRHFELLEDSLGFATPPFQQLSVHEMAHLELPLSHRNYCS